MWYTLSLSEISSEIFKKAEIKAASGRGQVPLVPLSSEVSHMGSSQMALPADMSALC